MRKHHFVIVCYPVQSHINPSLELANRLISLGHHVTLATTLAATRNMIMNNNNSTTTTHNPSLCLATLSDGGSDQEHPSDRSFARYFSDLERYGSQSLTNLINNQKPPFSFVIYTLLLNWAADVAASFNIQSALLFVQPATLLALYYYHFIACSSISDQQLPGLPLTFGSNDIPSFLSPSSPHACLAPLFKRQLIHLLHAPTRPSRVLLNTFDALETEALKAIGHEVSMLSIGPLISGSCGGGDCVEWLNAKAESSVVYVAFGSVCVMGKEQEEEIAHGLIQSGYTFLWVVQEKYHENEELRKLVVELGEGKGKVVGWCCQVQVLSHASLGCFVTHCGWNSTIEGLAAGVPMVGFPMHMDQPTNGKLVEDVWKSGVRVKPNPEGIVERGELRECLDLVMGRRDVGKREEILKNAQKWKDLARQAVAEGGSSDLNLKAFVGEIDRE